MEDFEYNLTYERFRKIIVAGREEIKAWRKYCDILTDSVLDELQQIGCQMSCILFPLDGAYESWEFLMGVEDLDNFEGFIIDNPLADIEGEPPTIELKNLEEVWDWVCTIQYV